MVLSQQILDILLAQIFTFGPKFVLSIFTLIIGWRVITVLNKTLNRLLRSHKIDKSLIPFLEGIISISLKALLIISIASMIGIETTSFVAVFGAASLAVGLALQGSLSNFAGGVLILFFKPFNVGDFIETQGYSGTVDSIEIFHTMLTTLDNKNVVIPNGVLSNGDIVNYTKTPTLRKDLVYGAAYEDDSKKVVKVLEDLVVKNKKILKSPKPSVQIKEYADSSINYQVRVWVHTEYYNQVELDMNDSVREAFFKNNISIPFPQRDVHIYNHK